MYRMRNIWQTKNHESARMMVVGANFTHSHMSLIPHYIVHLHNASTVRSVLDPSRYMYIFHPSSQNHIALPWILFNIEGL
jgi:hypothetical protein